MKILNDENIECFELQAVAKGRQYKVSFSIDGDFHLRFDVINASTRAHAGYLTTTIYSGKGSYGYILTPAADGIMCINKTRGRTNAWTTIDNLTIEEV